MASTDTGTDRNISLVAGWNLIGYAGNDSFALDDAMFTNSSGTQMTFATAVANNKLQAYLPYYDSSPTVASQRKYKYAATSELGMDASNLERGRGYWVYANQGGNLTLPGAGGTLSGQTYAWSKLRFVNSSGAEKNITDAGTVGWMQHENIRYWNNGFKYIYQITDPDNPSDKEVISASEGIFMYSNQNNVTLIRQN